MLEFRGHPRRGTTALFNYIAFEMGVQSEIDVHLVQMTCDEIDHDRQAQSLE